MPSVQSLTIQPKDQDYEAGRFETFIRIPVQSINLLEDYGIEGDIKGRKGSKRQVNLLGADWVDARIAEGYNPTPGQFGEQLIISGIDILSLASGTRLKLGEFAVLEITSPRTGCSRLAVVQPKASEHKHIGMMSKVITGGVVNLGDEVKQLN